MEPLSLVRALLVASYTLIAEIFFIFGVSMIIQNRTKTMVQRALLAWVFSLSVVGIIGTVWHASGNADLALILIKTHFSVLIFSAIFLWLFTILLQRDVRELDMAYIVPALLVVPIVWTLVASGSRMTAFGWEIRTSSWFIVFEVVLFGYYIAAAWQLWRALSNVRKAGDQVAVKRLSAFLYSVVALIIIGILNPISFRVLEISWLPIAVNISYILPPIIIAWTFQIENQ